MHSLKRFNYTEAGGVFNRIMIWEASAKYRPRFHYSTGRTGTRVYVKILSVSQIDVGFC